MCSLCKSIFRSGFVRCPADGTALEPLLDDPFVGQVFAGRYAIEAFAGQGAMGRVYRARHTRMSKRFAVKIMFGDLASDATMRARFQSEAEAASRLDHPNVVSVVDFGDTVGGLVYMVMDFVEGESLARLIERSDGPMSEVRVRRLLRQIALGLQHAHERGLVHRDLKTDNVVVVDGEAGEVARVIDFGIAMFSDAAPGPAKLTAVGVVIGTPAYMSPEQACGEKIDHRSDLFSLGIVAYEMLAGKKPFDGHPFEMARQNIASTPPRIQDRAPQAVVSPELEAIVFKLLAKDREGRFATAQAVVDALDGVGAPLAEQVEPTLRMMGPPPRTPSVRGTSTAGAQLRAGLPQRTEPGDVDLSEERVLPARSGSRTAGWAAAVVLLVGGGAFAALSLRDDPADAVPTEAAAVLTPAPDPSPRGDGTSLPPADALGGLPSSSPGDRAPAASPSGLAVLEAEPPSGTDPAADVDAANDPDEPAAAPALRPRGAGKRVLGDRRARITLEGSDDPVDQSQLTRMLRVVTSQVNLLGKQRGPRFAERYHEKLTRATLAYNAALRDPGKRRAAYDELEKLRVELSKL